MSVRSFFSWLVTPSVDFYERTANEYGRITLQQTELVEGVGWHCSIRAHPGKDKPRYAWTGYGMTIAGALRAAVTEAKDNPIEPIEAKMGHHPLLGGSEFDE